MYNVDDVVPSRLEVGTFVLSVYRLDLLCQFCYVEAVIEEGRDDFGFEEASALYKDPFKGKPYHLPCFRDVSLGKGGYRLYPEDAPDIQKVSVAFTWVKRRYRDNVYELVLNSNTEDPRRRIDPRTGNTRVDPLYLF